MRVRWIATVFFASLSAGKVFGIAPVTPCSPYKEGASDNQFSLEEVFWNAYNKSVLPQREELCAQNTEPTNVEACEAALSAIAGKLGSLIVEIEGAFETMNHGEEQLPIIKSDAQYIAQNRANPLFTQAEMDEAATTLARDFLGFFANDILMQRFAVRQGKNDILAAIQFATAPSAQVTGIAAALGILDTVYNSVMGSLNDISGWMPGNPQMPTGSVEAWRRCALQDSIQNLALGGLQWGFWRFKPGNGGGGGPLAQLSRKQDSYLLQGGIGSPGNGGGSGGSGGSGGGSGGITPPDWEYIAGPYTFSPANESYSFDLAAAPMYPGDFQSTGGVFDYFISKSDVNIIYETVHAGFDSSITGFQENLAELGIFENYTLPQGSTFCYNPGDGNLADLTEDELVSLVRVDDDGNNGKCLNIPGSYIMGTTPAETGEPWICAWQSMSSAHPKSSTGCHLLTSTNTPPNPGAIGTAVSGLPQIALGMFPASPVGVSKGTFTFSDKYSQPNPGTPACYTFYPQPSQQNGYWHVDPENAPPACLSLLGPP